MYADFGFSANRSAVEQHYKENKSSKCSFVQLFTCLVIPLFSVPEEYKCGKSLGPVESLQGHPQDSDKILIGYSRGLVVLWDLNSRHVDNLFLGRQVGLCASLFDVSRMAFDTL